MIIIKEKEGMSIGKRIMMAGLFIGIAIFLSALVFSTAMFVSQVAHTAITNIGKLDKFDKYNQNDGALWDKNRGDGELLGATCGTVSQDYKNECCERKTGEGSTYDIEEQECITLIAEK